MNKIALVTGGNRGLGLETAKQLSQKGFTVFLGARNLAAAEKAAQSIVGSNKIIPIKLDVSLDIDIQNALKKIAEDFGYLDSLVNNAGVFIDGSNSSILKPNLDIIKQTFEVNTLGALKLTAAMVPLLKKSTNACVVNVSSGMGQLSDMNGGYTGYRLSKTALNAVTKIFADELSETSIKVNSVCPGWVKTDMGGASAERDIPTGAKGIVWAATLDKNGPTGGLFRDGEKLEW